MILLDGSVHIFLNKQQIVDVCGTLSPTATVRSSVHQGSILEHVLFLIYVNDISAVVKNKLILYADDSAIFV